MIDPLHVAVGVISQSDGKVLVSRRPAGVHQGNLWEFPGGKKEPDETIVQALCRELYEELGIVVDPAGCFPIRKISHRYADKSVLLDVWRVDRFSGSPVGKENQPVEWRQPRDLELQDFPQANRRIIELLKLPQRMAITAPASDERQMLEQLGALIEQGVQLIQLRQPQLSRETLATWSGAAVSLCKGNGARLLVNTAPEAISDATPYGLHLNTRHLSRLKSRPVAPEVLLGASCHDLAQLQLAESIDCDYALLSPVRPTSSHPQARPLGWGGFGKLARQVSLPIFALGGLDKDDLASARAAGGHGIAAISAFRSGFHG